LSELLHIIPCFLIQEQPGQNRGLVEIIPEKTKKFIPSDPDSLKKIIDNKKKILDNAQEMIQKMKEFYEIKDKNPVSIGHGRAGFWKLADEMKTPKKYAYSIKWTSQIRPDSLRKLRQRLREKVDIKVLSRYDKETEKDIKKWMKVNKNIKKMDNDGFAFSVQDDDEVLLGLIKSNITLLIRNKSFAKVMKKMFLETYKSAEKID
jgi:sugar-specific transcriptional regulator TrmB